LLTGTVLAAASPAFAQHENHDAPAEDQQEQADPEMMDHGSMDHGRMDHGSLDHGTMDQGAMGHESATAGQDQSAHDGHENAAPVAPGHADHPGQDDSPGYGEGSGTARIPGKEGGMHGLHLSTGDWMVMLHGFASAQYTDHGGPRGDELLYSTSMLMLAGERHTDWGRIQLKSMMSLEPTMSARGYPNLFATGETADGESLVDRQHPHDLFMELAARVDFDIGEDASLFLYGGPVGEPALGPSAFMHRGSAYNNPEPPITHHWFDSTHITYGVVTTGIAARLWQLEASAFRGAEPDENRWDIETPRLDSWSVRATLTPSPNWAIQASYGEMQEPEALHPGEDEHRFTASVHYASGALSAMAAFSSKNRVPGDTLTAWLAEANWDLDEYNSLFGRFENVANDELFPDHDDPLHDETFRVSKFQLGYARHIPLTGPLALTLGASGSAYAKPDALDPYYGESPLGYTLFAKLRLGH
ncbi:MAG TPA: hypothetical protein VLA37_06930, partial [Sphingomonadaceae bacterium]|nr:hypothetical protein [Sphingomonadaceae bacterium]